MLEVSLRGARNKRVACPFCQSRNTVQIRLGCTAHNRCLDCAPWSVKDPSRGLWQVTQAERLRDRLLQSAR